MISDEELAALERELWYIHNDPLDKIIAGLTPDQARALLCRRNTVVVEGGNQSGKTHTVRGKALLTALSNKFRARVGLPDLDPAKDVTLWYCTTTLQKFGEQAWGHFLDALLYPGESIEKLPTRRILEIGWEKRSPETPKYIKIKRDDGGICHAYVRSYEQGAAEFQAKSLDVAVIDEECAEAIIREIEARFLAKKNAVMIVAATPIIGVEWLERYRECALAGTGNVGHYRLKTWDNPSANQERIAEMMEKYRDRPEELRLRLEGMPYASAGLVYPDGLFKAEHVCDPFYLDPGKWSFYRTIDHGYRNCAALWLAVSQNEDDIVVYQDFIGKERRIVENAADIRRMTADVNLTASWIDPATLGRDAESGERVIDLWRKYLRVAPAPDNRVMSGIERCKELIAQRGGPDGQRPRLRVFNTCKEFLRERRAYRWNEAREKGDEQNEKPEKRGDHIMDCFRYLVAAGIKYVPRRSFLAPIGSLAKLFHEQRNPPPKGKL